MLGGDGVQLVIRDVIGDDSAAVGVVEAAGACRANQYSVLSRQVDGGGAGVEVELGQKSSCWGEACCSCGVVRHMMVL